jgi:hypothetical protein
MDAIALMGTLVPSQLFILEESVTSADGATVAGPGPVAVQLAHLSGAGDEPRAELAVYVGPNDPAPALHASPLDLVRAGIRNATMDELHAWMRRGAAEDAGRLAARHLRDDHSASRRVDVLEREAPHLLAQPLEPGNHDA